MFKFLTAKIVMKPGVDLYSLVDSLDTESVYHWVGSDIVESLNGIAPGVDQVAACRHIFARMINESPEDYLKNSDFLTFLVSKLSSDKQKELERRIGMSLTLLNEGSSQISQDSLQVLSGFFGIEPPSEPLTTAALATQSLGAQYSLFDHQRRAAQQVWRHIYRGSSRVLLHMPTGAGKTRTAMHIIVRYLIEHEPCVIVWLASSAELLEQAADAFEQAWCQMGNREVLVKRAWGGGDLDFEGFEDGVLIGGLQKLSAYFERHPIPAFRIGRRTKLVVIDEAHQAIAPTYSSVIEQLTETGADNALIGLSATPGRTWNDISEDSRLSDFFDGNKVTLSIPGYSDPVSFLIDNGYLAKPEFRALEFQSESFETSSKERKGIDYSNELLEQLGDDPSRNALAIREIQCLISEGHKRIIFFSASVANAKKVALLLDAIGVDSGIVTGGSSSSQRTRTIRKFRRRTNVPMVMCNYGVLTTGFDAPETSAAVIARPTKSLVLYSQMVGRATRGVKAGGNETCTISTVVDTNLPGFGDIAEAFMNWEDVWGTENE
ncbi:DEAD/DEAH box helicase [Marinobacter sp. ELB17]|uniref:DEAD/DEAH box helicase n=1 Tax=Marinobacter sp. ELB17 TaxID=270374 RepID=UPI0000F38EDD|nr:DEAD/DEAH box helicase [Marinobacter sp. ELB17]EBA00896.1 Type III restriction enzyme, res subunit [Marinobacter sp. ELB17]